MTNSDRQQSVISSSLFLTTFYFRALDNMWLDSQEYGVGLQLEALITVFNIRVDLTPLGGVGEYWRN